MCYFVHMKDNDINKKNYNMATRLTGSDFSKIAVHILVTFKLFWNKHYEFPENVDISR